MNTYTHFLSIKAHKSFSPQRQVSVSFSSCPPLQRLFPPREWGWGGSRQCWAWTWGGHSFMKAANSPPENLGHHQVRRATAGRCGHLPGTQCSAPPGSLPRFPLLPASALLGLGPVGPFGLRCPVLRLLPAPHVQRWRPACQCASQAARPGARPGAGRWAAHTHPSPSLHTRLSSTEAPSCSKLAEV